MPELNDDNSYEVGGTRVPKAALSPEVQAKLDAQKAMASQGQKLGVPGVATPNLMDMANAADAPLPSGPVNLGGPIASPAALAPPPLMAHGAPPGSPAIPNAAGPTDPSQFTAPPAPAVKPSLMPVEQTTNITRGPALDKTQVRTMDSDFKAKQAADQRFADEQADIAKRQSIQQQVFQTEEQENKAQELLKQQHQDEQLQQATAKGAELAQNIGKVDPEKYRKDQGIGGNILSALAIGLGQFGAGITGGTNAALQIYKDRVNANIAAQEHAIQTQKDQSTMQNTRIGQIMSQGHDLRSAIQLDRASRYADLQRAVESEAAKSSDQTVQTRAAQMAAAAKQEYDNAMVQYQQGAKAHISTSTQSQLGVGGVPIGKGKTEPIPANQVGEIGDIDNALKTVDALQKKFGSKEGPGPLGGITKNVPGTDAHDYAAARKASVVALAKGIKGSNYRPGDEEQFEDQIPGAGAVSGDAKKQFTRLKAQLIQQRQSSLKAFGSAGYNTGALGAGGGAPSSFRPTEK